MYMCTIGQLTSMNTFDRRSGLVILREHGLRYEAGLEDAILPD